MTDDENRADPAAVAAPLTARVTNFLRGQDIGALSAVNLVYAGLELEDARSLSAFLKVSPMRFMREKQTSSVRLDRRALPLSP